MSYVYGIYLPGDRWAIVDNRRSAIRFARQHDGAVVRNRYHRGDSWDSITFAKVGELIFGQLS